MSAQVRVAMWSCSRNCSTAMMRAWESRPDTTVLDEPLYAAWLQITGALHPMRREILDAHEPDWRRVVAQLTGHVDTPVLYEKHISKHLLPEMDRAWLASHRHAFLIRDPLPMLLSFQKKVSQVTVEETGLPQQAELWKWLDRELGVQAPIVDARDLLSAPAKILAALCTALDIEPDERMLEWPVGRRSTDGIWASHWYAAVESSTCFSPYVPPSGSLTPHLETIRQACLPAYQFLHNRRIRLPDDVPNKTTGHAR